MALRRSYTDGSLKSHKLYRSDLTASLRWAASDNGLATQDLKTISRPGALARAHAGPYASAQVQKKHDKRSNSDTSEHQYHGEVPPDCRDHVEKGHFHSHELSEKSNAGVSRQGKHPMAGRDRTEAPNLQQHHATVEDAEGDAGSGLQIPVGPGAEGNEPALEPTEKLNDQQHPMNKGHDHTRYKWTNDNNFKHANGINSREIFPKAPVYPKIHVDYLSTETLKFYDIPWEYDGVSLYRIGLQTIALLQYSSL